MIDRDKNINTSETAHKMRKAESHKERSEAASELRKQTSGKSPSESENIERSVYSKNDLSEAARKMKTGNEQERKEAARIMGSYSHSRDNQ